MIRPLSARNSAGAYSGKSKTFPVRGSATNSTRHAMPQPMSSMRT
jgi:hypothetical protein